MLRPALTEIFGPGPGWSDASWTGSLQSVERHVRGTFDELSANESRDDERLEPLEPVARSEVAAKWLKNVAKVAAAEGNWRLRSWLVCLASVILRGHGSLSAVPSALESAWVPLLRSLAEDRRSLHACLDLLRCCGEARAVLECFAAASLRQLRHAASWRVYETQAESLKALTAVCGHVESRRLLVDRLMADIPQLLDAKPDESGLAGILAEDEVWWDTNRMDEEIEGRKEKHLAARRNLAIVYSELEELQVDLLRELLDDSDGNEKRSSSRVIFVDKLADSMANVGGNAEPAAFVCLCRLLLAFQQLATDADHVPCRVFYDGSVDLSRHERLGGAFSHLSARFSTEISSSRGSSSKIASSYALLHQLVLFYHRSARRSLSKLTEQLNATESYVRAYQRLKSSQNSAKSQDLERSLAVLRDELTWRSRHSLWIEAAVLNPRNIELLAYLVTVLARTFVEASREGDLFGFLPDFYLQTLAELCFAFRERLPGHVLREVAEFLCDSFLDPRIANANSRSCLFLMLARFAFGERELRWLEQVEQQKRRKLLESLLKAFGEKSWAEPNWILMRFWQGDGFAFRYRRSPHLRRRASWWSEDRKVNGGPCPSPTFQSHLRQFLEENSRQAAMFLNKMLDLLNWTFTEFVETARRIENVSTRRRRVPADARLCKTCDTCFELTVALLRVLEMTLCLLPDFFRNGARDNFLFRLCQLLCQMLNRVCSRTSSFERLLRLRIPELDSVDRFPILTAVTGVLLALFKGEIAASDRKVGKITETLLTEASFQIGTIHFLLADPARQFSLLGYPGDVTEDEIAEVRRLADHLDACRRRILANSTTSTETGNESCTICYAQPIAATFKPCNHQTCHICIDRHLLTSRACFFCKATIETVLDLSGNVLHQFPS